MTRLWDKGEPLDDRVLRYTAGEDHLLHEPDDRRVPRRGRGQAASDRRTSPSLRAPFQGRYASAEPWSASPIRRIAATFFPLILPLS